jgi:two-component system sensor histidine kinase RpfC
MRNLITFDIHAALVAQARLRFWWIVAGCVLVWFSFMNVKGGSMSAFYLVAALHFSYANACLVLAHRVSQSHALRASYLTAVLDPLMLTAWLLVLGEQGLLMAGLYLFTAIGYGMRIGKKSVMHVCQVASMVAFAFALAFAPYWQEHQLVWFSYAASIVVLPIYTGVLMDKLAAALRLADRESRAKSDLLARVSHELRTPLGGITNAAELIREDASSKQHQDLAATILTLSGHLLAEINELLDQSKLNADSVRLASDPVDIDIVADTVRASVATQAEKNGIGFQISVDPRIADQVAGDGHYLTRVLLNLAGNAVKFTEVGNVSVHTILLEETGPEYLIRFSIQDTGVGIPKDLQAKIFDPFFQVDTSSSRRYEGTGLGLAISKQIVGLMGGTLTVRSEIGKGSTFWFDLRMKRIARPAKVSARNERADSAAARRILIVDDNETNLYLLHELLELQGHQVVTAHSGRAALEILSGETPLDLVLLDYNLGDIDGAAVLQTYRFGRIRPAPTYFLTADASLLTADRLKASGAFGVLTKPVRMEELAKAIRAIDDTAIPTIVRTPSSIEASPELARPHAVPTVYLDSSVIDSLRKIGSRPAFVGELLARAGADIAANGNKIGEALLAKDIVAVRETAHALKGVCLEVGALRLMNIALGIMRADDHWLLTSSRRLIGEISDTTEKTRAALRQAATTSDETVKGRSAA